MPWEIFSDTIVRAVVVDGPMVADRPIELNQAPDDYASQNSPCNFMDMPEERLNMKRRGFRGNGSVKVKNIPCML